MEVLYTNELYNINCVLGLYGAVHIVRHARGKGVRGGVTVCDRGRGSEACDVTLINFFYHTYET